MSYKKEIKWKMKALGKAVKEYKESLEKLDNTLKEIEDWIFGTKPDKEEENKE